MDSLSLVVPSQCLANFNIILKIVKNLFGSNSILNCILSYNKLKLYTYTKNLTLYLSIYITSGQGDFSSIAYKLYSTESGSHTVQ